MEKNLKKNICVCVCVYIYIYIYIYISESLCCTAEINPALLMLFMLIQLYFNKINFLKSLPEMRVRDTLTSVWIVVKASYFISLSPCFLWLPTYSLHKAKRDILLKYKMKLVPSNRWHNLHIFIAYFLSSATGM